jgi:hypothetical protein
LNWDRGFLVAYILWALIVPIIACLMAWEGYINLIRYALCVMFFGGALLSTIGYWRYTPPGSTIPALLALLGIKSIAHAMLGLGFLVVAVTQHPTQTVDLALLITYGLFAAAGATQFFTGCYIVIGAGRGWIGRDVYKFPWMSKASQGDTKNGGHS